MARSYQDLLASAREQVPEVQVADLAARRGAGEEPLVIDVREQAEWDEGHIPGAVHITRSYLESRIESAVSPSATPPATDSAVKRYVDAWARDSR